jgi:hypothetical protein
MIIESTLRGHAWAMDGIWRRVQLLYSMIVTENASLIKKKK